MVRTTEKEQLLRAETLAAGQYQALVCQDILFPQEAKDIEDI